MVCFINTKKHGFTLLEVLIYITLFSLLMTASLTTVFELMRSTDETKQKMEVMQAGDSVLEKLESVLAGGVTLTVVDESTLKISPLDKAESEAVIFSVVDGGWYLARGARDPIAMTTERNKVTDVSISVTHPSLDSYRLEMTFTINETPFHFISYGYD